MTNSMTSLTPDGEIAVARYVTPALTIRLAGQEFPLPLRAPFLAVAGTSVEIRYRHGDLTRISVLVDGAYYLIPAAAASRAEEDAETRAAAGLMDNYVRRTRDALPAPTYTVGSRRLHEFDELDGMCGRCGVEIDDAEDAGDDCTGYDPIIEVGAGFALSIEWDHVEADLIRELRDRCHTALAQREYGRRDLVTDRDAARDLGWQLLAVGMTVHARPLTDGERAQFRARGDVPVALFDLDNAWLVEAY
ncbi:MAG TPA: hypothetical protein VGC13_22415 [Longimicrobium sp.]|jgi:hypothetical protein|uniref:hypothetical protein n=1 Tax=Longimicrobium sp. TaxID=2029185 RepID=UPI002ED84E76